MLARFRCLVWLALLPSAGPLLAAEAGSSPEAIEFFEQRIRPILVEHCYECHSAKAAQEGKLKGGLLVDSRAGLLKGGDSGPALEPNVIEGSLLLEALRYESFEMPPAGQLPEAVIQDFEAWIRMGAADPRVQDAGPQRATLDIEAGRQHWAYRPLQPAPIPRPTTQHVASPIDAFIVARLETIDLKQVSRASRRTLVRRIYFDLTGLPPTPAQIEAFVQDSSPLAYETLVDQLLATPQFGERWGRHWLDLARYADSITLRGFLLPEAWRYRDYVIEHFNSDRSYGSFLQEQIAGDLMPSETLAERQRRMIATTYLTLGNTNLEDQDKEKLRMDVVDEQLNTIGRGMLAQTIGCARCHDHKFDPIPTRDYYAMAGILRSTKTMEHANVSKWLERPLPLAPEDQQIVDEYQAQVARLQQRMNQLKQVSAGTGQLSNVSPASLSGIIVDDSQAELTGNWTTSKHTQGYVGDGYRHDNAQGDGSCRAMFTPPITQAGTFEIRVAYRPGSNRVDELEVTVFSVAGQTTRQIDQRKVPPIDGRFISLGTFPLEPAGGHGVLITNEGTHGHVIIDAVQFLSEAEVLAEQAAARRETNSELPAAQAQRELELLAAELKSLQAKAPQQPRVMTVVEEATIEDSPIHIRGDVHNLGSIVPRGFLQVAMSDSRPAISDSQSGRLQLGTWLADHDNPLPWRVMANRIWHWLFGVGLVRTTDNFGTMGEAPSHPELLDYLACELRRHEGSVKQVIRQIVLSHTYQLESSGPQNVSSGPITVDPENRLLWRMNRRRLDAECLLDAMLMTSGGLDDRIGGPTVRPSAKNDYSYSHAGQTRRAVYWPVLRNSLPRLFGVFDFANPSMPVGRRNDSSTPSQALFMLNNPQVIAWAETAANRVLHAREETYDRLEFAFELTIGREPNNQERATLQSFLESAATSESEDETRLRWTQIMQTLFGCVDFRYLE